MEILGTLPLYFTEYGDLRKFFITDTGITYGCLAVDFNDTDRVSYAFNDGVSELEATKNFNTPKSAIRFARRFAAEMRRAQKRNAVLTTRHFENF
jgi:hypothetical protein